MFEHEKKQLEAYRAKLEEVPIQADKLNKAIEMGVHIAEADVLEMKRKRRKFIWSFATVAILVLAFATTIRISPAFANAVSAIPGMGKIIELLQYDKGMQAIVDNDYYQSVHASQMKDDLTITIDGVILDETGMVISYTLEAPFSLEQINYKKIKLFQNGEEIPYAAMSYNEPDQKHDNRKEDVINFLFNGKQEYATQDFVLEIEVDNTQKTTFSLPFNVPQDVKKGKVYTVNQKVEVENQKIMIQSVTVHPLRVEVKIAFDELNAMKILNFEDMRIEDEKGEVWSKIQNGVNGLGPGENEQILYLQSNYFEQPKQLHFKFNKIQALPKEESFLLVDLETKKVLKQPSVGKIEVSKITQNNIEIGMPAGKEEFNFFLFSSVENENGESIETTGQSAWRDTEYNYYGISFTPAQFAKPLRIDFFAYPNYINGDIDIELHE